MALFLSSFSWENRMFTILRSWTYPALTRSAARRDVYSGLPGGFLFLLHIHVLNHHMQSGTALPAAKLVGKYSPISRKDFGILITQMVCADKWVHIIGCFLHTSIRRLRPVLRLLISLNRGQQMPMIFRPKDIASYRRFCSSGA